MSFLTVKATLTSCFWAPGEGMSEISSRKMSLNACENEIRFTHIVCEQLFAYNNHKGGLWLWKLKKNIFSSVYAPPEKVIIIKMKHFHLSPDSSRLVPFISVIWSVSSREPCALLSALLQCCSVLLWIICSLSNEQKWDSPARFSFHPSLRLSSWHQCFLKTWEWTRSMKRAAVVLLSSRNRRKTLNESSRLSGRFHGL